MSDSEKMSKIQAGLERLAFGSINDAVFLAFCEEMPPPSRIAELDLFNVAEIKRVKGGGVEIKMFDRQKALEKMLDCASNESSAASAKNLIDALSGGVIGVSENEVL